MVAHSPAMTRKGKRIFAKLISLINFGSNKEIFERMRINEYQQQGLQFLTTPHRIRDTPYRIPLSRI